ncbi:MAG: hypothetical protein ACREOG_14990 [Gemmatimonadaceae bacterium]
MKKLLRRIRGAVGMGLTWAVAWALVGVLIGVTSLLLPGLPWDRFFEVFDAPLPALAVPGFFGGALFSIVLGVAARRRRFAELSLPLFAVCGAVGGLLLSQVPNAMVVLGLATAAEDVNLWRLTAIISGPFALLGAASACITLMIARKVEDVGAPEASDDVGELSEGAARELLGTGSDASTGLRQQAAKEPVRRPSRDA